MYCAMSASWFCCLMRFLQESDTMGIRVEMHVALCTFLHFHTFLKVRIFKCIFIISLRISYMQTIYFEYIQSLSSPLLLPNPPTPPKFMSLSLFYKSNSCCLYTHGCEAIHWNTDTTMYFKELTLL